MSQKYHIKSERTKFYITTLDEKPHDTVITGDGRISIPPHSVCIELSRFLGVPLTTAEWFYDQIVTITPPLGTGAVVTGTILGVNGLYVALPEVSRHSTSWLLPECIACHWQWSFGFKLACLTNICLRILRLATGFFGLRKNTSGKSDWLWAAKRTPTSMLLYGLNQAYIWLITVA